MRTRSGLKFYVVGLSLPAFQSGYGGNCNHSCITHMISKLWVAPLWLDICSLTICMAPLTVQFILQDSHGILLTNTESFQNSVHPPDSACHMGDEMEMDRGT